jgi:hypothetical protein
MGGTMKRLNLSSFLLLSGMTFQGFALPSDSCAPGSTTMSDIEMNYDGPEGPVVSRLRR